VQAALTMNIPLSRGSCASRSGDDPQFRGIGIITMKAFIAAALLGVALLAAPSLAQAHGYGHGGYHHGWHGGYHHHYGYHRHYRHSHRWHY
jgi:hypothetical protein